MPPTASFSTRDSGVYLASYKGTQPGVHGIVNRGIRLFDRAQYSHTELCVGNPFAVSAECYSSSGVDGGVRGKWMRLNPEKWDVLGLRWVSPAQVRAFAQATRGDGYDYFGTVRFALPLLLREHPELWFCSEWAMTAIGVHEPWRLSPAGAHALCLSMGAIRLTASS